MITISSPILICIESNPNILDSTTSILLNDDFESGLGNWITDWDLVDWWYAYTSYDHAIECDCYDSYLRTNDLDTSTGSSITISFNYKLYSVELQDNVNVQYYNGTDYIYQENIGGASEPNFNTYTDTIYNTGEDAQYFIENFRLRIEANLGPSEYVWIDDVLIEIGEPQNNTPIISIENISIPIDENAYFYVNITSPENNITFGGINISWNPAVLHLMNIDDSVSDYPTVFSYYNNNIGYARIDFYTFQGGLIGNITTCRLLFEPTIAAIPGDYTNLTFQSSLLWDEDGIEIDHIHQNGLATICVNTSIVYVDDNFNESTPGWQFDHFANIQDGIDAVTECGTVNIYSGIYNEQISLAKPCLLQGLERNSVFITSNATGNILSIIEDNITVKNVTIQNSTYGKGIWVEANNTIIQNCQLSANDGAIASKYSNNFYYENLLISNCHICDNDGGIHLTSMHNATIQNCNISSNQYIGINISSDTNDAIIKNCIITDHWAYGIIIAYASNTSILNCLLKFNDQGIHFHPCQYCVVSDCDIENNSIGVNIPDGSNIGRDNWVYNNTIYHNIFVNNTIHAIDEENNIWNDIYPFGGNFWDDYQGTDENHDGIGDTPYNISGGTNQDLFPLINQTHEVQLPVISIDGMNIPIGEHASTFINVSNAIDTVIVSCNITWDPTVVTFTSLDYSMSPFDNIFYSYNNTIGYLRIDAYKFSPVGINGDFILSKLVFSAYEEAQIGDMCPVNISQSTLWNSDLIITPNLINNGFAKIMRTFLDINQPEYNRGFPIRHSTNGEWGAAQSFTPTLGTLTKVEIFIGKFGIPEFDLKVELREGSIDGPLLFSLTIPSENIPSGKQWLIVDLEDISVNIGSKYYIVLPIPPNDISTSFGYEWGYAFGNQYDDGSFWFTRDGGNLWRDLPTMYEFAFKTYGHIW